MASASRALMSVSSLLAAFTGGIVQQGPWRSRSPAVDAVRLKVRIMKRMLRVCP
jgi:hypothetical protein